MYVRVPTNDQVDKGFSPASQEEYLRKYFGVNQVETICILERIIQQRHSLDLNSKKMQAFCKQNKMADVIEGICIAGS